MNRLRLPFALLLALLVTLGLFRLMYQLINVKGKLENVAAVKPIEFVRLKRDTETETKKREVPDRAPPEKEPPPPELDFSKDLRPSSDAEVFVPSFDGKAELGGGGGLGGLASADSDVVPLVRVRPQYPARAARLGIEGWVEVQFTITTAGTVKDPRVVAYHPSTIFNKAVLRAVRRWKYNPRMEDGKAVERRGVIVRLTFANRPS